MRQETIFWWVSVLCSVILRAAGSALPELADKFALLLEYQTVNGLQHRLDQLLRRVEQIPREEKKDFSISCIMGVCLVEPGDTEMSILVDRQYGQKGVKGLP